MSSTLNSPNPRRTGSPGRSSGNLSDAKPVEIDYRENPEAYYSKLELLKTHAETTRKHDLDQEKTLMEYLPVNEKFNLNKEGKVIARWQERQRDWERIQAKIQRRLTSKVQKPLMMATADEYRARMEEYDLLQAAVPLKDRFSSSSWQVMLRGGGPIRVAVGHIFSGIECEVDLELPRPKMVRKPKPMQTVSKNDTFVDQSATYLAKKRRYNETIKEIRPHDLTYAEAGHLVIKSTNLFNWAKESSAKYYSEQLLLQEEAEGVSAEDTVVEVSAKLAGLTTAAADIATESVVGATPSFLGETMGAKVDFQSSKEVIFDCLEDSSCTKHVAFHNCGSVALTYTWRRVPLSSSIRNNKENTSLNGVLNAKGCDDGALRVRELSRNRECFFCLRETGLLLPEETASTAFVFQSCAGGGSFSSDWILEFYPEETAIYQAGGAGGGSAGNASPKPAAAAAVDVNAPSAPMSVGTVVMRLKGHCLREDESSSKRAALAGFLDQAAVSAMARDLVYSCLRRVRDPVRLTDLQNRQISHFRRMNAALLESLSARFACMLPVFVTPERLDMFAQLFQQASAAIDTIKAVLSERRSEYSALPATSQLPDIDISAVDKSNPLTMTVTEQQRIRSVLFPEEHIVRYTFMHLYILPHCIH